MIYPVEILKENPWNIEITDDMAVKFQLYGEILDEWNGKINLTAIKEPKEVVIKHFLDSIALLNYCNIKKGAKVIDVGTGAGFPGVPLKIVRSDVELTLLDSLNKRINFLNNLCDGIGITAEAIHFRAEEAGRKKEYREKFDIATARAVANLRELSEYCLPFVKVGGYFAAMKGPNIEDEIEDCKGAVLKLGGKIEKVITFELSDCGSRSIVLIKKVSSTPNIYPRPSAKMAKKPLY